MKPHRLSKKIIIPLFIIIFLYPGLSSGLFALEPGKALTQYHLQHWNMENGLPSNSIYTITQTRDGYLWLGTSAGLVRFDGFDFKVYNRRNTPNLGDDEIHAIYEDRQGVLWIGTDSGGLCKLSKDTCFLYPATTNQGLYKISAINEDNQGNLWIGSTANGLTIFNKETFSTYTDKNNPGLPSNEIRDIYQDNCSELWVTTAAGVRKIMSPGVFQDIAPLELYPALEKVRFYNTCLYDVEENVLWIGTFGQGLIRLQDGNMMTFGLDDDTRISSPNIDTLYQDRRGDIWIGTDGGGVTHWDGQTSSTLEGGSGLASGYVYAIYEDSESSTWIGTIDGGLHRLRDSKFITYTSSEGLSHDYCSCVSAAPGGGLWIGTERGLNRLTNGVIRPFPSNSKFFSAKFITAVFEDKNHPGKLWTGTTNGLYLLDYETGDIYTFTCADGLCSDAINCICNDSQGNTWVGTVNGLNRFDPVTRSFTKFTTGDGRSGDSIKFILEDRYGRYWIVSSSGLYRLVDDNLIPFHTDALPGEQFFRCAYEDASGTLWFGTFNGLLRVRVPYTPGTDSLDSPGQTRGVSTKVDNSIPQVDLFTMRDGLIENYIYSILEDKQGYLWLGGRRGISRVAKVQFQNDQAVSPGKHRLHPTLFNEMDGLRSGWCSGPGCITGDGRFWFPTGLGVTSIQPAFIRKNRIPPTVLIEKLNVDGNSVSLPGRKEGGANVYGNRLHLEPGYKRLEFHYTSISFVSPREIRFKVKLEGYDKTWVDMGNRRSIAYTELSPGNYNFIVTACNNDGVWNETGVSLSFYLAPYFYQTPWFLPVLVLFLLFIVFSLHRLRVSRLKAREKELSALVEKRTRDLKERSLELEKSRDLIENKNIQLEDQSKKLKELDQLKSRFYTYISHEFRTPLTLIMGPLEQMVSTAPPVNQHTWKQKLSSVLANSRRLLHLINQLLDLSKFDSGKMTLRASRQDIVPLVETLAASFESLFQQKEQELILQLPGEEIFLYFDKEKMENVLINLLANAIKYTPAGGKITISLKKIPGSPGTEDFPLGHLEIKIADTGEGIPVDQLPHIFDHFYRARSTRESRQQGTGIGLSLVKESVNLHHGEITVSSHTAERDSSRAGTEFTIRIPLGKEHLQPGEIEASPPEGLDTASETGASALLVTQNIMETIREELHEQTLIGRGEDSKDGQPSDETTERDIILVVDDNQKMRQYIRESLEPHFKILEAQDGSQGVNSALEFIPDLVISDVMMPVMDGFELCKRLKTDRKTSHIPVILLTAKASETSIVEGLETGADDYITKPFSTTVLLARIKNLIDQRRQLQANMQREMLLQPVKTSFSSMDQEFIDELKTIMEKNLDEAEFNVDALCKQIMMSRATLYRKIQALSGENPTQFIRSYRLKRAAELLRNEAGSITDVAFQTGFSSVAYFSKCFKDKFHCSPSEYPVSSAT